jgi:hypothetical protein
MADGAMRCKVPNADWDLGRVVKTRRGGNARCVRLDRAYPRGFEDPACGGPVGFGCGHVVDTGVDGNAGAERQKRDGDEQGSGDGAHSRRP